MFLLRSKVKKKRQKTFRGSNINWPRRKFQTHSVLARYFVICLLFIQRSGKTQKKTQIKLRGYELSMWVEVIHVCMHACMLPLYVNRYSSQWFPLAIRYPWNERKRLRLNSFIWVSAHSFHAPTFQNNQTYNQTYQPVHMCMHKTEWHRKKYLVIKLTNT